MIIISRALSSILSPLQSSSTFTLSQKKLEQEIQHLEAEVANATQLPSDVLYNVLSHHVNVDVDGFIDEDEEYDLPTTEQKRKWENPFKRIL